MLIMDMLNSFQQERLENEHIHKLIMQLLSSRFIHKLFLYFTNENTTIHI